MLIPKAKRVSEQVNLFMTKSKNIYFERQVPREIMRPSFSEQINPI
ncbi:hypothetical protein [Nostoc sp. CHAB 5715]|nr:hypothetical protein [Nostoc sp. CHAB 5715]MCC5622507.1 hypothetical protein [Nostoc sp. CHAB 5715]